MKKITKLCERRWVRGRRGRDGRRYLLYDVYTIRTGKTIVGGRRPCTFHIRTFPAPVVSCIITLHARAHVCDRWCIGTQCAREEDVPVVSACRTRLTTWLVRPFLFFSSGDCTRKTTSTMRGVRIIVRVTDDDCCHQPIVARRVAGGTSFDGARHQHQQHRCLLTAPGRAQNTFPRSLEKPRPRSLIGLRRVRVLSEGTLIDGWGVYGTGQ